MVMIKKNLFIALLFSVIINAQPLLVISPDEIEFVDIFNRLENVYFINQGNSPMLIDSIVYNNDIYYVRFDQNYTSPFYILPGDSVKMDCILAGYYYVPSADTLDTMYVYSNGGVKDIKIEIEYFDDDQGEGIINGQVTDGVFAVPGANIYVFYEGNYLIMQSVTDQFGYFSFLLPPGSYTIAAEKDSFYVTFYGQRFDPFSAEFILLEDDSLKTANISLVREEVTGNSVSGVIYDSISGTPLRKGIVVVRNGTHTPTKMAFNPSLVTNGIYTAFIKSDGFYSVKNITEPDYYFIQSFSDYFTPSYYSSLNTSPLFWQLADSVYIETSLSNLNIFMPRDSSIGGGYAAGSVNINTRSGDTITGVILYAQPVNNDSISFNYAFTTLSGNFNIPFLPYGDYRLLAQKIGYYDGYSSIFTIDPLNTDIRNLQITLIPTSVKENPFIPESQVLLYNYPNPFNPNTKIAFNLPFSSDIEMKIFNIIGEEVDILLRDYYESGYYEIDFNGEFLTSGVYFVMLKTINNINLRKILLLK